MTTFISSGIRHSAGWDFGSAAFFLLWIAVLIWIVYGFLRACGNNNNTRHAPRNPPPDNLFPGGYPDETAGRPPPPYSKNPPQSQEARWTPGFWTGAAVGGLGAHLWNSARPERRVPDQEPLQRPQPRLWDWERSSSYRRPGFFNTESRNQRPSNDDRGEGTSNLGTMRRSTGLGGSNVR